jgi:hypothetical protein
MSSRIGGPAFKPWDFAIGCEGDVKKPGWIDSSPSGHDVLYPSYQQRPVMISACLRYFVAPHWTLFAKWDRGKIAADASSMEHFRQLVARSGPMSLLNPPGDNCGIDGNLQSSDRSHYAVPRVVSRRLSPRFSISRSCLLWLGPGDHGYVTEAWKNERQAYS